MVTVIPTINDIRLLIRKKRATTLVEIMYEYQAATKDYILYDCLMPLFMADEIIIRHNPGEINPAITINPFYDDQEL